MFYRLCRERCDEDGLWTRFYVEHTRDFKKLHAPTQQLEHFAEL